MISVIVPIYKVEKYLPKCIDSIINQTYKDLEIVLVDDGSPDGCPQICDEYAKIDNRIVVIHKENGGLSDARNAGLDIATGDYISFIDSDDYIEPTMYEKLLDSLIESNADMSICGFDRVNDDGKKISSIGFKDYVLSRNDAYEMLVQGNVYFIISCNKLFKREIFDDLRFKLGKTHEDEFIIHHIYGKCKKISTINESLYHYLIRESSIMGSIKGSIKQFDGNESCIDRIRFFASIGENHFAARMVPITIKEYFDIQINVDNSVCNYNHYCEIIKNEIRDTIKTINVSSLPLIDRIGVMLFCINERFYVVWSRFVNFLRKIKSFFQK